jgi:hypothetical protein
VHNRECSIVVPASRERTNFADAIECRVVGQERGQVSQFGLRALIQNPQIDLVIEQMRERVLVPVAERMGTTKCAISRLDAAGKHAPSLATLKRYAKAVGCALQVKFVPQKAP